MTRQLARRNCNYLPHLETLEDRRCPAVSVSALFGSLVIIGDSAANTVTITDQGDGNIAASITGSSGSASGSGSGITKVVVFAKGGDDAVTYDLTGPLTSKLNVAIDLGYWQDLASNTNSLDLNFDQAIASPYVNLGVVGTKGKDNVTASFAGISDSYLNLAATLYGGDDSFDATLNGDIDEYSVAIGVAGGGGTDTLGVHVNGNVGANSYLGIVLGGGGGDDPITVDYQGQIIGKLYVLLAGNLGKDTIAADLTADSGSTGTLAALVHGGDDDDDLTLNVNDNSGGTLVIAKALINGGNGTLDKCTKTSNVVALNCEL